MRRKFLRVFPGGFRDETYIEWERDYKWNAHRQWDKVLLEATFRRLIEEKKFIEIAVAAVRAESPTNLLFSFEKMALRDAVRTPEGAKTFAIALFDFLHGSGPIEVRFNNWVEAVSRLPRIKTRVLTWPLSQCSAFWPNPAPIFSSSPP